ncbi:unnamed protein product [Echinostoma caproni]|uniref:BAR domain-containing protein n=1 Tax=Echinostoma caproni TaxID=27848 RepID=A0A183AFH1_9TREM|nr:unnamed protein product [Echinostoma caproni]
MDFKKILDDTQSAVDRIFQATNEALGRSEKTEYDAEFMQLSAQADVLYNTTKKIIGSVEFWVNPHPGRRLEDIGQALKKCGEYHRTLATIENERNQTVEKKLLLVFFHFMQYDWVGLQTEMKKLQAARLDYDMARNKSKKETQADPELTKNVENLRAQFEAQMKETRTKLESMKLVHQNHIAALKEFVGAECRYFNACLEQARETVAFLDQLPDNA